jgi:hypothetical protein
MARKDETGVPEFLIPFQVDQSWYERYWWQDSAPRKPGLFAFFRRILSQQRLTRRLDVRTKGQRRVVRGAENFRLSLSRLLWLHRVGRRNEDGGRP